MGKGILRQIFIDHWDDFVKLYGHKIRKNVLSEVKKMMHCGSIANGYIEYKCPDCENSKKIGFRCRSRFCTSCGKVYVDNWVEDMTGRLINAKHRHMVFTIPEELRILFQQKRELLALLPKCAAQALKSWFKDLNKRENFTPGIVAVIHTFGRDLKWNPHVHMLVTEGAAGTKTSWKSMKYIPYNMLRKRWQKILLDEFESEIGKRRFKELKDSLYQKLKDGFYVYAKGEIKTAKGAAKYVGRYTGRPAIAESRIIKYDGKKVVFYYQSHEDGKRVEVELDVYEFIKRVIVHIPEKQFKMVRYYGIYSRNNRHKNKFIKLVDEKMIEQLRKLRKWKYRIMKSFGHDPLSCEKCNSKMELYDIYHKKYGSMLNRYEQKIRREIDKEVEKIKDMYNAVKWISRDIIEPIFR